MQKKKTHALMHFSHYGLLFQADRGIIKAKTKSGGTHNG